MKTTNVVDFKPRLHHRAILNGVYFIFKVASTSDFIVLSVFGF